MVSCFTALYLLLLTIIVTVMLLSM